MSQQRDDEAAANPHPLNAPFPYFGGKKKIAGEVWKRFGNPTTYVEPFAGSMAVLLGRPREHAWWTRRETVNDAAGHIVNFYRAVKSDPAAVAQAANWPISEADLTARHLDLVERQADLAATLATRPKFYDAELAGWWIWGISAWVGGEWCSGLGPLKRTPGGLGVYRKMPMAAACHGGKGVHRTLTTDPLESDIAGVLDIEQATEKEMLDLFTAISQRLRRVRILCGDWNRTTRSVVMPSGRDITAVFLDPPYALAERRANLYGPNDSRSKSKEDPGHRDIHVESREWALSLTDNTRLRVAYCTYDTTEETALFEAAGWTCLSWSAAGGYGLQSDRQARTNRDREVVWFSPSCLSDNDMKSDSSDISAVNKGALEGEEEA